MASHRLPIFQDDLSFRDRNERLFGDLGYGLDRPFGRLGNLDDDFDRMCKDFFELRPRSNPKLGQIRRENFGSHESLDDDTQRTLFRENPETKGRLFEMSFDVKGFEPSDISLRVQGDSLLVEAKHEADQDGVQNIKEFSRNIKIPKEVDPDKLESRISNDGILTIQAPVPPKYSSIAPPPASSYARQGSSPQPPYTSSQRSSYGDDLYSQKVPLSSTGTGSPYVQQTSRPYSPQYTVVDEPRKTYIPQQPSRPAPQRHNSEYDNQPLSPSVRSETRSPPGYTTTMPSNTSAPYTAGVAPPCYSEAQTQPRYTASMSFQTPNQPPEQASYEENVTMHPVKTCVMDQPVFSNAGQGRRMDLSLMLGEPYTPDDIVVKVDGRTLLIEATHEEKKDKATSKTSMSREFDLVEDIDPNTVQANLTSDGRLKICANVIPPKEKPT